MLIQGDMMKKKDVIAKLKKLSVGCKAELVTFFENYMMYTESLCSRMSNGMAKTVEQFAVYDGCTTEEAHMVQELCNWLQDAGFEKFLSVYTNMDVMHEKQIKGFVEAYSYILSLAKDNVMQLVDQLFFIPGQFVKDLEAVTEDIGSKILEGHINLEDKLTCSGYKFFNTRESFNGIPCFN